MRVVPRKSVQRYWRNCNRNVRIEFWKAIILHDWETKRKLGVNCYFWAGSGMYSVKIVVVVRSLNLILDKMLGCMLEWSFRPPVLRNTVSRPSGSMQNIAVKAQCHPWKITPSLACQTCKISHNGDIGTVRFLRTRADHFNAGACGGWTCISKTVFCFNRRS